MSEEEPQSESGIRLTDETIGPVAMMIASFAFAGLSSWLIWGSIGEFGFFSTLVGVIGTALIALAACTLLLFRSWSISPEEIGNARVLPAASAILAAISGMAWWLLNLDLGEGLGMPVGIVALLGCLWAPLAILSNAFFCLTRKKYLLLFYVIAQCVFFAMCFGVSYFLVKVSESC